MSFKLIPVALKVRLVDTSVFKFSGLVGVVVRLKKWVKTVGNVFLFSMVFAHGAKHFQAVHQLENAQVRYKKGILCKPRKC